MGRWPGKIITSVDLRLKKFLTQLIDTAGNRPPVWRAGWALAENEFIAGDYSIADIACYPWIARYEWQEMDLNNYGNIKRWFDSIAARPATQIAYAKGESVRNT